MADVVQMSDYEVSIGGATYSTVAIPAADSGVVVAEKNRLLKNLKLENLISDLFRAGDLLNLAYNVVAGFGDLRGAVTSISDRLRVLAADCELTMQRFELSAGNIAGFLKDCFKFLMSGREEAAIIWLGKAGDKALGMSTEAYALADRFDTLGNDAVKTLVDTQKAQGETEAARTKLEAQIADLNAQDAGARKLAEGLVKQKEELQQLYDEAKEKAETHENRAFALSIVNAIMKPLGEGLGSFAGAVTRMNTPAGMMPPSFPVQTAPNPTATTASGAMPSATATAAAAPPTRSAAFAGTAPPGQAAVRRGDGTISTGILTKAPPGTGPEYPPEAAPDDPSTRDPAAGEGYLTPRDSGATSSPTGSSASTIDPAATAAMAGAGASFTAAGAAASQMSGDVYALAEGYRKQKESYLKNLLELKKVDRETAAKIAEYAVRLKNSAGQVGVYSATVESLLQAIGALKGISTTLRLNALFWRQMGDHCKELAQSDLKEKIEVFKTFDDRLSWYREPDFKEQLVYYMAGWKAIQIIAQAYGVECGKVRAQINEDFNKNPSTEQSQKIAPILGAKLLAAANTDLESMKAEEARTQQELDATIQAA
jgi:hypothetical protein